ncbi:MAG TPA: universal stress protein [Thermoflexales bacterium]|nr:universal stress protein [Thermoflexales bacterium]
MFKHFLIPLDGSRLAEAILPAARFFAQKLRARITFLHVVEPSPPATIHGQAHLMNRADAETYLQNIAAQCVADGIPADFHVDSISNGDVARGIFSHVDELSADLVLLADHGRSGMRGAILGSIAQQVLHSGRAPVLLVKAQATQPITSFVCDKILVPLDGQEIYENSLDVAAEMAQVCGAALQLITVVPTPSTLSAERSPGAMMLPSSTRAVLDVSAINAAKYLDGKAAALNTRGIRASALVERGEPSAKIVEARAKCAAALIVMATHGRAGVDAFWSGSVAPRVVDKVSVPVLLLRVTGEEPVR